MREALPDGGTVAVALSGGRDSVALLDAAAHGATSASVRLVAFHVHHGLSAHADDWARLCRDACAACDIPFALARVEVEAACDGIEASARARRYDALATLARAHRVDAVLLAHHADDQAETMLLQLARGAGPHGLAGMPAIASGRGTLWLRPFLGLSRAKLDAYVARHALAYVDDDSNANTRFRRNALRAHMIPALREIAPGYPGTLARAANLQADAAALLDELAALDATSAFDGKNLDATTLGSLSEARARNLLRWFLREQRLRAPSAVRLAQMLSQLRHARGDARISLVHDGAEVGVHRGRIVVHRIAPAPYAQPWYGGASVDLPHGTLHFVPTLGSGIAARCLASAAVTIRAGKPGERLMRSARGSRRSVAELLREAGVPGWARTTLPRLYCGDTLAAVPYLGVDAAFAAQPDERAFRLDWRPR
ncbi:MAG TPA: tRNA lysidine(34) synthetase TilS [Casimicrobiaceae bacterium]|nr:tRNA lysidine(34) synthetase TilS [Casimicrobiaceae bacterium]